MGSLNEPIKSGKGRAEWVPLSVSSVQFGIVRNLQPRARELEERKTLCCTFRFRGTAHEALGSLVGR